MTDFRDLSRRVAKIEREDAEQTAAEWAAEYAAQQSSSTSWEIEDVDPDHEPPTETDEGVLITTWENEHYCAPFRADREEIPDQFDPDEDFPV